MTFLTLLPFLSLPLTLARQVNITIDASRTTGTVPPSTRFFGADEPNQALYPDGTKLIHDLGTSLGPHQTYFRAHNLLTTCDPPNNTSPYRLKWGCTNAYTENEAGEPVYNFTIVDDIFDTYLSNGVKPYVQASFMPKALAVDPEPYTFYFEPESSYEEIYVGWSHPTSRWKKLEELMYEWTKHCVERYGVEEVRGWYWEVWNEPNIPYWNGTQTQYFTLYDHAIAGIRRALPDATVGGPEVAGGPDGDWLGRFLDHTLSGQNNATGGSGAPLDFISFHAKGFPTYVNASGGVPGHLQMNVSAALHNVEDAFKVIQSYEEYDKLPVVIGEDDPDGCAACESPDIDYRNGLVYPSYTVASFVRQMELAVEYGTNLVGQLTWAFQFENHAYFDKLRVLSTRGINKPILNVFRLTAQYTLDSVVAGSIQNEPDVGVLASTSSGKTTVTILVWNYHDDDLPKPDANIQLNISSIFPGCKTAEMTHYRIDQSHSNAYSTWLAMGSPHEPTERQYVDLVEAGELQMLHKPAEIQVRDGRVGLQFALPIHGVSMLVFEAADA